MYIVSSAKMIKILTAQKISPEGRPKVQLQIVLHDISSYTFHFCTSEGRENQIAERNKVKVRIPLFVYKVRGIFCVIDMMVEDRFVKIVSVYVLGMKYVWGQNCMDLRKAFRRISRNIEEEET